MSKDILIFGKNSSIEYINGGNFPKKVLLKKNIRIDARINHIIDICSINSINITYTKEKTLNEITNNQNHQGIVLIIETNNQITNILDIKDIIKELNEKDKACIVLLDSIQDNRNLGAILRSAEFFGINAVILPTRNSATISNEVVYKTSSGAIQHIKLCQVKNLNQTIEILKKNGFWIYGTHISEGENLKNIKFDKKTAIIIGSEDKGIKKSIKEKSDFLIYIERFGNIDSLNASVASGILFYEYSRQNLL